MRPHRLQTLFVIAGLLLSGCASAPPTATPAPTAVMVPSATTAAATATPGPTATPDTALRFPHTPCAAGVDLSGQTIKFYHLIDLTTQLPEFVQPLQAGLADAADYFNAHGGLCGASLANDFPDSARQYDAGSEYHRLASLNPKPALIAIYDSGNAEQLRAQFANDQILALGLRIGAPLAAYDADGHAAGWVYSTNPLYTDQFGAFCQYISQHPQQYPKPLIGYLGWSGASGDAAYTPETIAYCASLGVKVVDPPLYFEQDATDIHALVQNLVDTGANILYTSTLGHGTALVAKTLVEMGLQKTIPLAASNWAMDPSVGLLGQAAPGADGLPSTNGLIGSLPVPAWNETDQPGIQFIAEQADLRQRPLSLRNNFYILAWASTDLYIELYLQTGNRVGFDHITGVAMKQTLDNLVYSPLGGIETVDFKGGTRRALSAIRMVQMAFLGRDGRAPAGPNNPLLLVSEGGQELPVPLLLPLSDFQPAPDLRPGGADVPALPQPTATVPPLLTANQTAHVAAAGRITFGANIGGGQDSYSEIFTMNADGTNQVRLTNDGYYDGQSAWSPDRKMIVFVSTRDSTGSIGEIYSMNSDGSSQVNLTNNPADEGLPAWSPDSQKIAFVSDREGNVEVYVMNADGSGQTRLTNNPATDDFPSFSPDGKKIVFDSDRDGHTHLVVMNADGSGQTPLTNGRGDDGDPVWSPDGQHVAFRSNRDGNDELYVMNADGTGVVRLTNNPAHDGKPAWSPDGRQIAFDSERDGKSEVYLMNADGSGQTRLTDYPFGAGWPSWVR